MANERIVLLKKAGLKPEIEFKMGNAQWVSYKLRIYTKAKAWELVGDGVSWDSVEDRFPLGKPLSQLDGSYLHWTLAITPLHVGDPYSVDVNVYQGPAVAEGGAVLHRGTTLLDTHPAAGLLKVVVA